MNNLLAAHKNNITYLSSKCNIIYCVYISSHIIPECLGANLKLPKSVCEDCNKKIGSTIEAKICNDFSFYRFLAQVKTKKGKQTSTVAELEIMGNKVNVKIGEGGVPKCVPPIIVDEGPPRQFLVTAESPEKLKKIVNSFEKMGIMFDPEKMAREDVRLIFTADKRYIASNDYLRVATKIAFERLCYISPQRAYNDEYDKVRNFIRFGKYQNRKPARLIYEERLVNNILGLPFPFHGVLLFAYGRLIASIVSIFGLFYYYVILNDNNRILQNWAKFIYIDPHDRKAREPILKSDYSLRRILSLVWVSLRDPDVVQKSQKYAKVKFDEIVSKIKIKNKTD